MPHRIESIRAQTFADYEVIACDSGSDDGTLELLRTWAEADPRVKVFVIPREGIYPAWNQCIAKASGTYVYWATSDDSMTSTCLAELYQAALAYREPCVVMCGLNVVDGNGARYLQSPSWDVSPFVDCFPELSKVGHVRKAPFDGLAAPVLHNIWQSSNQLLIPLELYHRLGSYRTDMGPSADFEWNVRAGLVSDVVFIPQRLATFVVHTEGATSTRRLRSSAAILEKIRCLESVAKTARAHDDPLRAILGSECWRRPLMLQLWLYSMAEGPRYLWRHAFKTRLWTIGFFCWLMVTLLRLACTTRAYRRLHLLDRHLSSLGVILNRSGNIVALTRR